MGQVAAFANPVAFLSAAGEFTGREHTEVSFLADLVRDFPEFIMVRPMVLKFSTRSKRNGVDHNVVVRRDLSRVKSAKSHFECAEVLVIYRLQQIGRGLAD